MKDLNKCILVSIHIINFIVNNSQISRSLQGGYTALHIASHEGHSDTCEMLLTYNADVDTETSFIV